MTHHELTVVVDAVPLVDGRLLGQTVAQAEDPLVGKKCNRNIII